MPSRKSASYDHLLRDLSGLLEQARRSTARAVNTVMTATYWETGRRIVEFEQGGEKRAGYGDELLTRLADDLTARFCRGFGAVNLSYMKRFYGAFPPDEILQTLPEKSAIEKPVTLSLASDDASKRQILSGKTPNRIRSTPSNIFQAPFEKSDRSALSLSDLAQYVPLSWSHNVLLISRSRSLEARAF